MKIQYIFYKIVKRIKSFTVFPITCEMVTLPALTPRTRLQNTQAKAEGQEISDAGPTDMYDIVA